MGWRVLFEFQCKFKCAKIEVQNHFTSLLISPHHRKFFYFSVFSIRILKLVLEKPTVISRFPKIPSSQAAYQRSKHFSMDMHTHFLSFDTTSHVFGAVAMLQNRNIFFALFSSLPCFSFPFSIQENSSN